MKIWVLTLFPEMFQGPLSTSILKRAKEKGLFDYQLVNFRDFAKDRHRTVDDTPYGGGAGMVLKPEPVFAAVDSIMAQANSCPYRILTTPQGEPFNQRLAKELAAKEELLFICGHYEGYDERIRSLADREISIGDYVLTGGELATMVMIDAIVRLIPGALGDEQSAQNDSFSEGLLDYPQYTKPAVFRGLAVPEILLSGHHARIAAWRRRQALQRTAERRPDLLAKLDLTAEEREMLQQMGYPAPTCEE
ncbi:MAG TPA: tRNA (guanosine(37)-N1)-methyltransferase TrmD [Firmicutes bacterium]|nr:tRNA (guanosine(37)-N1)-methyltransferase TrmD [Bacillota bacterium]HOQ24030.1 tRNA (guanosine(37)-N1)-methyltransferase TrmD [Bacillota bacterium]HPT67428.1 tRNA (guanosine(37)-N1)-methyltransferase TrmD [Bacillota bacterium]